VTGAQEPGTVASVPGPAHRTPRGLSPAPTGRLRPASAGTETLTLSGFLMDESKRSKGLPRLTAKTAISRGENSFQNPWVKSP
jgi:hypothetical protein